MVFVGWSFIPVDANDLTTLNEDFSIGWYLFGRKVESSQNWNQLGREMKFVFLYISYKLWKTGEFEKVHTFSMEFI